MEDKGKSGENIAEGKSAESAVKNSERKYRTLVDNALAGIFKTNLAGEILYVNGALSKMFEYDSPEEMKAHNVLAIYKGPGDREALISNLRETGKVDNFEMELYTKTGGLKNILLSATLEDDIISGMIIDITRLKRAEDALRVSEKKYRDLYDNAPDMYHSLDRNGIIIDCNETEARTLGYKKEELIGRPFTDFVTEESKRLFKKNFPRLNRERSQLILEREFIKKDGAVLPVSLNVFNEFDENGEFIGTKTIARDITDRRKMEEELLKVQKLESISLLAGGIAHDFNNLLTAIFGNIAMAKLHANPGDRFFERLDEAEKASLRAKDLTQQLLTFSKGGEPVKKTASIAELVKESIGFTLSGSSVKGEIYLDNDLRPVEVDEGQISQVINNLVLNAEQAMPEGGIVRAYCRNVSVDTENMLSLETGNYVRITVEDEGTGIPKEHLRKIFDPYFTTKQKGNGLGLAAAYSIIRKHNGCITVESALGAGATFHVYLPASQEEIGVKEEIKAPRAGKGRVLVMDDEAMVRNLAGDMLSHIGYEVEVAREGAEAIRIYESARDSGRPFDAVILDLTVPGGMGGKTAIRKLLEIDPGIKAIVSSGYSNDPVMADFRSYGFSEIVPKPYRLEELSKALYKVIAGMSQ